LAVKKFAGLLFMPADAAEVLMTLLERDPLVRIGKSRSVRGTGVLTAEVVSADSPESANLADGCEERVYIVQSPLLVGPGGACGSARAMLSRVVHEAGWGEVEECAGSVSVLFGWNRHRHGMQKAVNVLEPGSVFRLKKPLDDPMRRLAAGIGGGRERGCGAVLPHPGIATGRYQPEPQRPVIKSGDDTGRIGWEFFRKARDTGLSASQVSRLLSHAEMGEEQAVEFMDRQRTERPARIWDRWEPVFDEVKEMISADRERTCRALRVWRDLAVASGTGKEKL
jgi:hypothetical protein